MVEKVPESVKAERLRKINRNDQRKGRTTSQLTRILQGYNLYISNASEDKLNGHNFKIIYTIRWQLKLIFKSWKSNFCLDEVSGVRVERIKCMIYAKLLFIFISSKIISLAMNYLWLRANQEVSEYRAAKHLKIVAQEWVKLIIQNPNGIQQLQTSSDFGFA